MGRVGGRQEKMEEHCSTGESPQWAVVQWKKMMIVIKFRPPGEHIMSLKTNRVSTARTENTVKKHASSLSLRGPCYSLRHHAQAPCVVLFGRC